MENKQLPLAAIVICNYNYEQWILDAIKSAALQDYPNKVIYVVDDCSTDNSVEKVKEFLGTEYNRFLTYDDLNFPYQASCFDCKGTLVYLMKLRQNGGPSRARNFALKHAIENGANIISILDADDIMMKNKVSKCILPILSNPEVVGLVYADYYHMNTENENVLTYECKEPFSMQRLVNDDIVHSGFIASVPALQSVGTYYDEDLRVCEDYCLILKLSQRYLCYHVAEPLTIVRIQPQNSSLTVDKQRWQRDYYLAKQRALGG